MRRELIADPEELLLYDFQYPASAIADAPASPRDSARLMVVDKNNDEPIFSIFSDLGLHLPDRSIIVMNETKVVPARFTLFKPSGGKVVLVFVGNESGLLKVISDRKIEVGSLLVSSLGESFFVKRQDEKYFFLSLPKRMMKDDHIYFSVFYDFLDKEGKTPLPPYIKTELSEEVVREEYQTVFAKEKGSMAAPTASLHFTDDLMDDLKAMGHEIVFITLHVGLGTFAPLSSKELSEGKLHKENYSISPEATEVVSRGKREGRPIIAVGTTVMRTLESAFDEEGNITQREGETDLFIREGYRFKMANGLITNFHVPKSSLMMLVSAFMGRERLLAMYKEAIEGGFRLFSFGDGMLIKDR